MPGWKINCLKSEDGINPSILISNTIDETNKTETVPSPTEHENAGKVFAISKNDFYRFDIPQD
jgi:hypothetical protein